jgi:hypothetical protein
MPEPTCPILGLDFSGARDAGRKIWLAEADAPTTGRITIARCFPAAELTGGSAQREQVLPALRDYLAAQRGAVIGCDFPFSLHVTQIGAPDWLTFIRHFAQRFPDETVFRATTCAVPELRRRCDLEGAVPFAPTNLRLYRQTYYGIRDLLAPLSLGRQARIVPMQPPDPKLPCLIEVCPASYLKSAGLYESYKGKGIAPRAARERIRDALDRQEVVLEHDLRERLIADAEGDALDSVIAALIAARAVRRRELEGAPTALEQLEGRVFGL